MEHSQSHFYSKLHLVCVNVSEKSLPLHLDVVSILVVLTKVLDQMMLHFSYKLGKIA